MKKSKTIFVIAVALLAVAPVATTTVSSNVHIAEAVLIV